MASTGPMSIKEEEVPKTDSIVNKTSKSRSKSKSGSRSRSRSGSSRSRSSSRSKSRSPYRRRKSYSRSRSRSRSPARKRSPTPESTTIFVDKLTRNVNKEHLLEIFGKYGKIKNVDLLWDRRANLPKGSAYIEFNERPDAEHAQLAMDGGQIDGNVIKASFILTRKKSPPRFNGPRRGGLSPRRRGSFRGRGRRSPPRRRGPPRRSPPYRRRSYSRSRSPPRRKRSYSRSRSPSPKKRRSLSRSPSPKKTIKK